MVFFCLFFFRFSLGLKQFDTSIHSGKKKSWRPKVSLKMVATPWPLVWQWEWTMATLSLSTSVTLRVQGNHGQLGVLTCFDITFPGWIQIFACHLLFKSSYLPTIRPSLQKTLLQNPSRKVFWQSLGGTQWSDSTWSTRGQHLQFLGYCRS